MASALSQKAQLVLNQPCRELNLKDSQPETSLYKPQIPETQESGPTKATTEDLCGARFQVKEVGGVQPS